MKIRIMKRNIIDMLMIVALFLDSCMFYLIPQSGVFLQLNSQDNKYLIALVSVCSLFPIYHYANKYIRKQIQYRNLVLYVMIALMMLTLFSMIKYDETPIDVFTCMHHYILLLLVIPFSYILEYGEIDRFLDVIVEMSIILCVLTLFAGFIYNTTGRILLSGIVDDYIQFRHGNIRMSTSTVNNIAVIIICSRLFFDICNFRKRILYVFLLLLELFINQYVYMSRSFLIIYAGVIVSVYMASTRNDKLKRLVLVSICVFIGAQFIDILGFLESFSINSVTGYGGSTLNRINAIVYFSDIIKNNPLFGMGYIRNSITNLRHILHGPYDIYYVTDLGFYGLIAESGIIGGVIYLLIFKIVFKTFLQLKKKKKMVRKLDYSMMVGILTFVVLSSINEIQTNPRFSLSLPIIISLSLFYKDKYQGDSKAISYSDMNNLRPNEPPVRCE